MILVGLTNTCEIISLQYLLLTRSTLNQIVKVRRQYPKLEIIIWDLKKEKEKKRRSLFYRIRSVLRAHTFLPPRAFPFRLYCICRSREREIERESEDRRAKISILGLGFSPIIFTWSDFESRARWASIRCHRNRATISTSRSLSSWSASHSQSNRFHSIKFFFFWNGK